MPFKLPPATKPVLRAQLSSRPANGHTAFIPQVRKLVFEYSEKWPSSSRTRTYLNNHLEELARTNPHVEVVVQQKNHREPIVRGFYLNGRDKVISLKEFEVTQIQQKVQLLLDSSGAKIKPLKRRIIESSTESARGIWSGLHVPELYKI
ncbi:hypothetical protein GLOTRDRAFT_69211 [Gloeophyllum trabeum ATCC 11539]|uniref:Large ribosomal subunit protein mL43 n=1 Tax=Gloeophyllum trabeum (strain ATCC 11539 / FP-39264 / Madison 617) TaxID=670483 RepID=S7QNF1_GLOTA|nr:uncharacterized protein GLOTRDRAFT_69211 [Gloeophyllum trabeum ATCC 11539]EPQ61051.1 hypothetical protein GLOTRDRAFT_69211 [Gloeophyllum trabeum ATCC 11539]